MAGDWIKMRSNLWDDPRVARLCDLTDQAEAAIVGGLYWLWAMADQHTEDGLLPGMSLRQLDRKTGVPGLGSALCEIGWLEESDAGLRIIRFEDHNGSSAKRRSMDASRKASSRASSAEPPAVVRAVSASDADKTKTRCGARERVREESNTPPIPPTGGGATAPKAEAIGFPAWCALVKAGGQKLIPEDDPVFAYAERVGLPDDFLRLAWREFHDRYSDSTKPKRYRDWRAVFRNAVRGNWFKLWWHDGNGYALTTAGMQAAKAHQRTEAEAA